jgi:pyruvate dehydrogenase E2 component (dihydrolipoamide acetyltransferase)
MPTNILMPALSPTMTEGKLAKWLKNEGDEVKAGDVIAEIETDKATMEVEAVDEGKLHKILVPAGTEAVKVNEPIAVILGEGEDPSAVAAPAAKPAAQPSAAPAAKPAPAAPAPTAPAPAARAPASAHQAVAPAASPAPAATPARATGERIFASPLARRLAAEGGIDLGGLSGSGPHGRIIKADIEAAQARGPVAKPTAAPAAQPAAAPVAAPALSAAAVAGTTAYHLLPATTMRKVIARRMVESKQQVPHFYLSIDCELDQLLKLRADLNAKAPDKGEGAYKLSVNDFVIRASALALRKVPAANAAYSEEGAVMFDAVDISVAVAIPGGLITPIVRNADQKGLAAISSDMKALAGKAREGKLKPEEFQGGTFSISNLGMFGVKDFQAVINPPQGAILAVGAGEQRPVVKAGALAIATVMTCTLSVDHRVLDGAIGAEFLAAFKKLVEDPITMLL